MSGRGPERLTAVVLRGSGSDDDFVRRAFAGPLRAVGIRLVAPAPRPGRGVVDGYRTALDTALGHDSGRGPPPGPRGCWPGASHSGRTSRRGGRRTVRAGSPGCCSPYPHGQGRPQPRPRRSPRRRRPRGCGPADSRRPSGKRGRVRPRGWATSWTGRGGATYGDALADALLAAAREPGPDEDAPAALDVPAGVIGLVDDPVHPLAVARPWSSVLPRATLLTTSLGALGGDPAVLGRAAVLGWLRARLRPHAQSPRR